MGAAYSFMAFQRSIYGRCLISEIRVVGIDTGSAEGCFATLFYPPSATQLGGVWPTRSAVLGSASARRGSILTGYSCSLLSIRIVGLMPKYCALGSTLAHSSDDLATSSRPP